MEPIIVRGGGDIATGSIYRLVKAGYPVIVLEIPKPSAIRRSVAFCQAIYEKRMQVEDMTCILCGNFEEAVRVSKEGNPALLIDPEGECLKNYRPWFLVDAILAKKNLGTTKDMADVVVGLGPGFTAGEDVDLVVETMRGHRLGRVIAKGPAMANTGIPGVIAGYGKERVMHSPAAGVIHNLSNIADLVEEGQVIAEITTPEGKVENVYASLTGVLRGIINEGFEVTKGLKIADIDPRKEQVANCFTISDKARAIGGSVLELACAAEHGRIGNYFA